MRNAKLLATIIGMAILPLANATTVGFATAPASRTLKDSSGVNLSTSSLVWAGNFGNESFSFDSGLSISANVAAITAAGVWEQFGVDTATDVTNAGVSGALAVMNVGPDPKLGGSITDNSFTVPPGPPFTKADYFDGTGLYVWVFNAPSVGAATEMGIFKRTAGGTPWVFPTNTGGVGDDELFSTVSAVTIAAVNGIGSTSSSLLQLTAITPVPEPSTFATGAMLALAAMQRRRRRG